MLDTVLAFAHKVSTLYRQRVTPLPFNPSRVTFDQASLTTHINTAHASVAVAVPSTSIAQSIYSFRVGQGFNSDRVTGTFMSAFNPALPIKTLTLPTIGAAWNLFEDRITSFFSVITPIPLSNQSPTGRPFVSVRYNSNSDGFPTLALQPLGKVEFGKPNQKYRVLQPTQFNTPGVVSVSNLTNGGFTQTRPNVFEAELKELPNGQIVIGLTSISSPKVREFFLSGDILPPNTTGFFKESELASDPKVQQITTHIATYPHHGIRDDILSNTTCLSASTMSQRYSNSGLQNGAYGGDSWGANSHPPESVPNGTLVYWVALYNGELPSKTVKHPDGTVLARPVNGKRKIRCAFELPAEITPIPDEGVLLRRCNPTMGYKMLQMIT